MTSRATRPERSTRRHGRGPRRLTVLAASFVAAAAGIGLAAVPTASAEPAPTPSPITIQAAERYWACVAVDQVHVGTCLQNPLPDLSGVRTVPDIVGSLLG